MDWKYIEVLCSDCRSWFQWVVLLAAWGSIRDWQEGGDLCRCPRCGDLVTARDINTRFIESY